LQLQPPTPPVPLPDIPNPFAVIVLWGGLNVMVKEHTRSPYHETMDLLPRLLLGALAANLSLSFARFLIDLNNLWTASVVVYSG